MSDDTTTPVVEMATKEPSPLHRLIPKINWGYALGELTIVVADIVFSLALNTWWRDLEEQRLLVALFNQLAAKQNHHRRIPTYP